MFELNCGPQLLFLALVYWMDSKLTNISNVSYSVTVPSIYSLQCVTVNRRLLPLDSLHHMPGRFSARISRARNSLSCTPVPSFRNQSGDSAGH